MYTRGPFRSAWSATEAPRTLAGPGNQVKHLIFMIALTIFGTAGAVLYSPFYGVISYFFLAVLRPQSLWAWSLPPAVRWSLFVSIGTLIAIALKRLDAGRPSPIGERQQVLPGYLMGARLLTAFVAWQYVAYVFAQDPRLSEKLLDDYRPVLVMFIACSLYI